mgnify:CR=1 FL=1
MPSRSTYWSNSKLADWLRGTAKLSMGTADEWDDWHTTARMRHNFRYWLAEDGLDHLQNAVMFIPDKLNDVRYYINNRWITRTHALTAHPRDIKPGQWRDVGNRFLPCLFNELVDFVEVELAWWHLAWSPEERPKYNMPWWAVGWWRVRTWRCPQAGLDNLEWQRKLVWKPEECEEGSPNIGKPTQQAIVAQEILDLYMWWKKVYPYRLDPMDASGWSAYCELKRENGKILIDWDETDADKTKSREILDLCHSIEEQQTKEDEEMMIRLIRIRNHLWT